MNFPEVSFWCYLVPQQTGFNFSLLLKKGNLNSVFDQLLLKPWLLILAINSSRSHLTLDNVENSPSVGAAQHAKEATQ